MINCTDHSVGKKTDPVSYEVYLTVSIIFKCFIQPTLVVFSIVSNVVNAWVFSKTGLKDSASVTFLALSLSDMAYLFISAFMAVCFEFYHFGYSFGNVDPYPLLVISVYYSKLPYDFSMIITTYIAVTRCCLVARPLHFKNTFTRTRTSATLVFLAVATTVIYIPLLSSQGVHWKRSPTLNTTRLSLWFSDNRHIILSFFDVFNRTILPNVSLTVVLICMIVLASSLRSASKFREASAIGSDQSTINRNRKTIQVIKTVVLVSLIFCVCNIILVPTSLARQIEPEFNIGGGFHYSFTTVNNISGTIFIVNTGANIFIYYYCNPRFREILKAKVSSVLKLKA